MADWKHDSAASSQSSQLSVKSIVTAEEVADAGVGVVVVDERMAVAGATLESALVVEVLEELVHVVEVLEVVDVVAAAGAASRVHSAIRS